MPLRMLDRVYFCARPGDMRHSGTFSGTFFDIDVPEGWEYEIIEDIPAFFDPDTGGVLQIAASRKNDVAENLGSELRIYLEQNQLAFLEDRIVEFNRPDGIRCLVCEFSREGRFWMVQFMASGDRLLIVLFNSDAIPPQDEAVQISEMIQSIRFTA